MIEVEVEVESWTSALADPSALVVRAAEAALMGAAAPADQAICVLLTDDAVLADLNGRFAGKTGPTNVLSFPAPPNPERRLGDIALAYGVCAREAAEQGKALADHLMHLSVHGVLHLLGYDHQTDREAEAMEALERSVLKGLGVADPYAAERV